MQEADNIKKSLEMKEKQLLEFEEKLNTREKVSTLAFIYYSVFPNF